MSCATHALCDTSNGKPSCSMACQSMPSPNHSAVGAQVTGLSALALRIAGGPSLLLTAVYLSFPPRQSRMQMQSAPRKPADFSESCRASPGCPAPVVEAFLRISSTASKSPESNGPAG